MICFIWKLNNKNLIKTIEKIYNVQFKAQNYRSIQRSVNVDHFSTLINHQQHRKVED